MRLMYNEFGYNLEGSPFQILVEKNLSCSWHSFTVLRYCQEAIH